MTFILSRRIAYYTKQTIKLLKIIAIALAIIIGIILIKFKPAYAVSLNGEKIGYVGSEKSFQEEVDENILQSSETNVAFVKVDEINYSFNLVNRNQVDEDTVYSKIEENATNIYRVYEIANLKNEDDKIYVDTMEEAENIVNSLKEQYSEVEPDLAINTIYLDNVDEVNEESIMLAKAQVESNLQAEVEEKSRTINDIYLACVPVTGMVTSRFGAVESVRDHTHMGIDIAASAGTSIMATADGTVKFAGTSGGYGNLVIIDHGNGVETYYGHCSRIYVSAGSTVVAGETIAAVGSTGNSTGNHLHFEIRLNGSQVNPEQYVYK